MLSDNLDKSLLDEEKIPVGSVVSNKAHPYQETNTHILITNYAHFTPPLMVVVEKNYGAKYSSADGKEEDNDSYKCLYYSTINGCFETNWFKRREIKFIENKASKFLEELNNSNLEELKRRCLGRTFILSSVDLELGKKKIWSDDEGEKVKMKTNNLLDYLPPLGTVIDVKYNDDYQKFNEKNGKPIHRKSKILLKIRWLNNITAKFSEEYVPLVALKPVDNNLREFESDLYYLDITEFSLEENDDIKILKAPLKIKDILWKHYYYIYRFVDQFTKQIVTYKADDLNKIETANNDIDKLLFNYKFDYKKSLNFSIQKISTNSKRNGFKYIIQIKMRNIPIELSMLMK